VVGLLVPESSVLPAPNPKSGDRYRLAYNEESDIARRLENLLVCETREKLELVVTELWAQTFSMARG
jgi:hypothetical protein